MPRNLKPVGRPTKKTTTEPEFTIGKIETFNNVRGRASSLDRFMVPLIKNFDTLEVMQGFLTSISDPATCEAVRRKAILTLRCPDRGQRCSTKKLSPTSFYLIKIQ